MAARGVHGEACAAVTVLQRVGHGNKGTEEAAKGTEFNPSGEAAPKEAMRNEKKFSQEMREGRDKHDKKEQEQNINSPLRCAMALTHPTQERTGLSGEEEPGHRKGEELGPWAQKEETHIRGDCRWRGIQGARFGLPVKTEASWPLEDVSTMGQRRSQDSLPYFSSAGSESLLSLLNHRI